MKAVIFSVLFLGNSYVYENDLPKLLRGVGASLRVQINTDASTHGKWKLSDHARSPKTLKKLDAGRWDAVILQEQSLIPGFDDARFDAESAPFAAALIERARAASPNARIVFYSTWGWRDGDQKHCREIPAVCSYAGHQERVTRSYQRLAAPHDAVVAPVGEAWRRVRAEHPEVNLYQDDGSHPSLEGSYLAACVLFSALTRQGVMGASALGLPPEQARLLQRYAQEAVFGAPLLPGAANQH